MGDTVVFLDLFLVNCVDVNRGSRTTADSRTVAARRMLLSQLYDIVCRPLLGHNTGQHEWAAEVCLHVSQTGTGAHGGVMLRHIRGPLANVTFSNKLQRASLALAMGAGPCGARWGGAHKGSRKPHGTHTGNPCWQPPVLAINIVQTVNSLDQAHAGDARSRARSVIGRGVPGVQPLPRTAGHVHVVSQLPAQFSQAAAFSAGVCVCMHSL